MEVKIIVPKFPNGIAIGEERENLAVPVVVDYTAWIEQHGAGALQILLQRPQDADPYPVTVTNDNGEAVWTPNETDMNFKGRGEIQLVYTAGGVIERSPVIMVISGRSLVAAGDPPDPFETWLEELTELAAETLVNAQSAEDSASEANADALRAAQSAADAETAKTGAEAAATTAGNSAALARGKAAEAAQAAQTAVENADYSETQRIAAESAAVLAADSVERSEAAEAGADQAKTDAQSAATAAAASASTAAGSAADAAAAVTEVETKGAEQIAAINQAGTTQIAAVDVAGAAQVQAIEDKGEEVIASIPSDYTELADDVSDLKSSINQAPEIKDSEKTGVDLDVSDPNGNVILRLADGHIKTKNFDSADIDADIFADSSKTGIDLDVADDSGYVVARFAGGHVKTKNFDSEAALENLAGKIGQNQGAVNAGKVLTVGQDGLVAPEEPTAPDSKPTVETFSTTVEFKNGTAMNVEIAEKFSRGDKVLFHVEDGYKNYESGALATYYENGSTIVASRRGSNGYLEYVVTADNATLSIRIPASGYDNDRTVTLYVYRINGEVKPKIVTVAADGTGMYTTIRGAIDSITDANAYTNPYEIWVYPGTYDVLADYTDEEIAAVENPYTQTSFVGPKLTDGMSIKGVGNREDVILTATLDPEKWGSNVRGQVSTLNTQGSGSMENLTIRAYNIRYCVHDDFRNPSNQKTWRVLRNLTFGGSLTNTPKFSTYGAGMATPRDYLIEDCDFVYTLGIHGNTNYSFPCHIKLNRCSGYAFFIGDYADEDTDAVIDVEVNDCNFERMYIVAHTPGLTKPHVRLYGVGNEQTMVVCSSLYHYVFGNIVTIEPGFDPGTVVAHTASTDMFEATSNWDIATGVVISADSEHSFVQRNGFITAEMIGLTGLTVGDYVTVDPTTHKVTGGGTAADAIGVVVWIEAHGYTVIKLRGGF